MKTRHDKLNVVGKLAGVQFELRRIRNGGACCRIAEISPVEELIHLSMTRIFLLDFVAEHMFRPFSQVS